MSATRAGLQPRSRIDAERRAQAPAHLQLEQEKASEEQPEELDRDPTPGVPAYLAVQRQAGDGGGSEGGDGTAGTGSGQGAGPGATGGGTGASAGAPGAGAGGIRRLAGEGVATAADALPGLERIQAAFGRHDVSGLRVQVGGAAGAAAERMGARAYALGDRIAFRRPPDLRLAAHEAAHVIQQRQGIHLVDGVGRPGDPYERHADAVAQRVVGGQSAEDLLDAAGDGQAPAAPMVQHECDCGGTCSRCRQEDEEAPRTAGVQMELDTDAARLFEVDPPAAGHAIDFAESAAGSAPSDAAASVAAGSATGDAATADADREGGRDAESAGGPTPEAGGPTAATVPGTETDVSSTEPVAAEAATDSAGTVNAQCYRAGIEEPEEEPETEPAEPEGGDVHEEAEAEVTDPEGGDDCPVGEALDAAGEPAEALADGTGEATTDTGAGGGEGAPAGSDAGSADGGGSAAAARSGTGGEGGDSAGEDGAIAMSDGMDMAIAESLAARDGAVAGYGAARMRMAEVATAARANAVPVDAVPAEPGQREIASAASGFFRAASGRLDDVVAQTAATVPARLGGLARAIKADIGAAIEDEKSAIGARIGMARSQAWTGALAAVGRIQAAHATATAGIEASAAAALATLDAARPLALGRVDDAETTGLDDINQAYADSRANHESIGRRIGAEATARGAEYRARYEHCKIHRRDSWTAGHLTDRRAEAQQDAADKTAEGYRKNLEDAATKAGRDLAVAGRPRDRCGLIAIAGRARESLDAQYGALYQAIQTGRDVALAQADAARDQLLGSVGSALGGTLDLLDSQEYMQRQAANDTGYLQQVSVEQAAHAAAASVLNAVADAVDGVSGLLGQARMAMRGLGDADPAAAAAHFERLRDAIDTGMARLMVQALTGTAMAESRLLGSASAANAAMALLAESHAMQTDATAQALVQGVRAIAVGGVASLQQQSAQATAQLLDIAASGTDALDQIAAGMEMGAETMLGNIHATLERAEADLEAQLRTTLRGIDSTSKGIPHHAQVAASKEQPAWKSVVKWVLIIAIVIVVALVIGPAVIGAVGAAAGAMGASAAAAGVIGAVVGGAIVGAATSATIQVINNWAAGMALGTGVGRAAIMGAIGGAFGGAAGQLIGRAAQAYQLTGVHQFALNIGADTLLEIGTEVATGEFSWDALGMSVLMSVATGGFGEIPRVRAVQARVQHLGAAHVPGAGAARFAESIRPPAAAPTPRSAADVEAAGTPRAAPGEGPAAPVRGAEGEGGAAPRTAESDAPPRGGPGDTDAPAARTAAAESDAPASGRRPADETPHRHEDVDAAAGRASAARAEGPELDAPARSRSDDELVESTAARSQVGDEQHVNSFRRNGDRIECEICSVGCGRVRDRITEMREALPDKPANARLRQELADLHARVADIEQRLESPGSGVTHREAIDASAAIAQRFREIGERFPAVGTGIDRPRSLGEMYDVAEPRLGRMPGHEPVRTDNLGARTGPRQDVGMGELGTLRIRPNEDVLYVLRDVSTGAIMKVGKTTGTRAAARFNVYRNAGSRLGLELRLEVTPVPRPRSRTAPPVEVHERALRARLEQEGHVMPWDNSPEYVGSVGARQGRLGRAGPGTPYDSRRAALRQSHEWSEEGWLVPRLETGE